MNYNFFADKADKLQVLDFLFEETDLCIYDHYSPHGEEIRTFNSTEAVESELELASGNQFQVCFQLWSPRHGAKPLFRKVELDPKRCNGHTFRYATNGWGLIQLYFGGLNGRRLYPSHIGHFSEKGALRSANSCDPPGNVNEWNWKEISTTSRKLQYHIDRKLSVGRLGSYGILAGAARLQADGVVLSG